MLRVDRLELLTEELADQLERIPDPEVYAVLPPAIAASVKLMRRLGVDVVGQLRAITIGFLRQLPEQARRDPYRADRWAAFVVHGVAWLTDQTDEPPPPPPLA